MNDRQQDRRQDVVRTDPERAEGGRVSTHRAARELGVCRRTIRNMIQDGRLDAVRQGERGHYRVTESSLDNVFARNLVGRRR